MFADGHLLTQIIHIFLLLKIKRCWCFYWPGSRPGLIKFCGSESGYDQSGSTSLVKKVRSRVRRFSLQMYLSNVSTSPTFVLVRRLYQSDVCTVWRLYGPTFVRSDVCTVRRLYGPTFVRSDVCTVWRLYGPTFVLVPFYLITILTFSWVALRWSVCIYLDQMIFIKSWFTFPYINFIEL